MTAIHPSILNCDIAHLADELDRVTGGAGNPGADGIHVDVMDNHFVPNLSWGLPVVEAVLAHSSLPVDAHLMIRDADRWAPTYAEAGCQIVTPHAEATRRRRGHRTEARHTSGGRRRRTGGLRPSPDHDRGAGLRRPVLHRVDAAQDPSRSRAGRHQRTRPASAGRRRHHLTDDRARRRGRRRCLRCRVRGLPGRRRLGRHLRAA